MHDIIVVGAGPMGISVAIEAKRAGLSCLILEKGALVNSLYHFPVNMTFFSTSEKLEIGEVPFISHGDKPTRTEALEYFRRVIKRWDLVIRNYETVSTIEKQGDLFTVQTSRTTYKARHVIVATGFYDLPNLLNIPGEDLPKVKHYYNEPHPYIGKEVVVIGAANSACDVALELFYKGAKVTMLVRGAFINERVKYWIKPNIENRIKEGSIKAFFNSRPLEIKEHSVLIQTQEGEQELPNDFVLAMTGYTPDYSFLKKVGIQWVEDDYHTPGYNEQTHETNIPGLYLAGVVCGGLKTNRFFIENSKDHAEKIIKHIKGK
jgi:thioredoxin reductase (NADPH)